MTCRRLARVLTLHYQLPNRRQTNNMPVLQIKGLTKRYGRITALDNVDLQIEAGNIYGLLGPNGSGKTTTLGIILGVLQQDEGTFEWFGGKYGDKYRVRLGAILETPNFYPYLNADDNLDIVADIKQVVNRDFDYLLDLVNLTHRRKSTFRTYSLGMKQRLAIAATLIGDPDVVLFDEPTNGLDPEGITEVRNILQRVAATGKTVIMASHLLDEVEKICTHAIILKNGKLLSCGPVGTILNDDVTIEVAAKDMVKLRAWLATIPWIKTTVQVGNVYECTAASDRNGSELNFAAFENGLVLTHLMTRKRSLEEEFLEITNQHKLKK